MVTFLHLLTAYLSVESLSRFLFTEKPRRIGSALARALAFSVATIVSLGSITPALTATLSGAYFVLLYRVPLSSRFEAARFVLRHGIFFILLGVIVAFQPECVAAGWWPRLLESTILDAIHALMSLFCGIVLIGPGGSVLIKHLVDPINREIRGLDRSSTESNVEGLKNGGQLIGLLERLLTLILVMVGQPNGIGFLIAAKSILRFGGIKDSSQRKTAEYIIIGTFLSFGWAILIAFLTDAAVEYWNPLVRESPPIKIQLES